jgi:Gas vesicle synthesis protein GvpL/GvpF
VSAASPAGGSGGIYVYGVVAPDAPSSLFEGVPGVDPAAPVVLLADGMVAAITSAVSLDEFGADVLPTNLRDPGWLEAKVRAHDAVLGAAIGNATVVPFRFGTIYESEEHVREMLGKRRDLPAALERLRGMSELGVAGYLDRERLRARLAEERGLGGDEASTSGRAYMQRRQLERELDASLGEVAARYAQEVHDVLAAIAADARTNPLRPPEPGSRREMFLNGAYLVREDDDRFDEAVAQAGARYGQDAVTLTVTGPWPPYNFAEEQEE